MNDTNSLSHTKWNCKYHIVFAPKYRRKVFYKEKRREVGEILRTLCEWKNCGSRSVPGSCTHAVRDTAKGVSFKFYGIFEREKQLDDLRKISGVKIQIQKPGILV